MPHTISSIMEKELLEILKSNLDVLKVIQEDAELRDGLDRFKGLSLAIQNTENAINKASGHE